LFVIGDGILQLRRALKTRLLVLTRGGLPWSSCQLRR
jgi:hypothetical protein